MPLKMLFGRKEPAASSGDVLNRKELRQRKLGLAFPAMGERILTTAVSLVDTALVGHLGAHALAAVSLASESILLSAVLFRVVGTGATALIAHCVGGGNWKAANRAMHQSLVVGLLCGPVAAALASLLAKPAVELMGAESAELGEGVTFLRIASAVSPLSAIWEKEIQTKFGALQNTGLAVCLCCDCCCDYRLGLRVGNKAFRKEVFRPEGVSVVVGDACERCGACAEPAVCSVRAVTLGPDRAQIDLDKCVGCGHCMMVCPNHAIQFELDPAVDVVGRLLRQVEAVTDIT